MPQMPEPIDLRKSKKANAGKVLTGAVVNQLEDMDLGRRASAIMYSLTAEHIRELDDYFTWKDEFELKHRAVHEKAKANFEAYYNRVRYDSSRHHLFVNGKTISFISSLQARALLEVLFEVEGALYNDLAYLDFFDEYKEELTRRDITKAEQVKQARRYINAKVSFFPVEGRLRVNNDYL